VATISTTLMMAKIGVISVLILLIMKKGKDTKEDE